MHHGDVSIEVVTKCEGLIFFERKPNFVGLYYNKKLAKWTAYRWSKKENKDVYNGSYKVEKTAARASDTLARELLEKGEKGHKLNFPDDNTEVHAEVTPDKAIFILPKLRCFSLLNCFFLFEERKPLFQNFWRKWDSPKY